MPLSGEEILSRAAARYASCATYQDAGDHITTFNPGLPKQRRTSRPFQTWFIRPDFFRFETRERTWEPESQWEHSTINQADGVIRSFWTLEGQVLTHDALRHPLMVNAGQSGGVSSFIPRLLISPGGAEFLAKRFEATTLTDPEPIDDETCHHLTTGDADKTVHLWVGIDSLLIRKLVEESQTDTNGTLAHMRTRLASKIPGSPEYDNLQMMISDFERFANKSPERVISETTYTPQFDHQIDPEVFRRPL